MGIFNKIMGKDGATVWALDPTHFAGRVSGRPMELGARGAYSAAFYTGAVPAAFAAAAEIFQFRFVHASFFALLRSVHVSMAVSTTGFAAGVPIALEMRNARAWTGQGTSGTGITWGADDGKKRKDFATTVLASGDVRIMGTTALGAGTKTLDGTATRLICGQSGTAVAPIIPAGTPLWLRDTSDEYPFLYENQEGFVIRNGPDAWPATGLAKIGISIEWAEIDPASVSGW